MYARSDSFHGTRVPGIQIPRYCWGLLFFVAFLPGYPCTRIPQDAYQGYTNRLDAGALRSPGNNVISISRVSGCMGTRVPAYPGFCFLFCVLSMSADLPGDLRAVGCFWK